MKEYVKPNVEEMLVNVQMPLAESIVDTGTGNQGAGGDALGRRNPFGNPFGSNPFGNPFGF